MVFGVIGNTLRTSSGRTVCIREPSIGSISMEDIAHALSRICRFGGHVKSGFYSVAQHSINCRSLARHHGESREVCLAVLMHDAAEAYLGDVIKPLKIMLPEYGEIEKRFEELIGLRFGIDFEKHSEAIKMYDHALLVAEKSVLLSDSETLVFTGEDNVLPYPWPTTLRMEYAMDSVKDCFISSFLELRS